MSGGSGQTGAALRWRAIQLAGVQAVYFVRLLVLAQLLAPESFGLVAIAIAAIGVLARVSDLGMIQALVQRAAPTTDEYDAAWSVGLIRAIVIASLLSAFAVPVATLFGEPGAAPILQALAWRPAIEAAASIGIARATREMQFRQLALLAIPAALADIAVALATATWLGVWALVAGSLAGSCVTLVLSYVLTPHAPRFTLRFAAIEPLVRYGRWVLITGIVALVGSTLTQIAISRIEGVAALGLYFLAARVAFLPIDAASAVVSAVAFPTFARLRDDPSRTAATFRALLTGQAVVLVPAYALMFVLAPTLEAALGGRWEGTAPVIRILAISAVTGLLGELVVPLLMGRGRSDRAFVLEIVQTSVQVAVLVPLVLALGVFGAAIAWLAGNVAALLVIIVWLRSMVPRGGLALDLRPLLAASLAAAIGATIALSSAAAMSPVAGLIVGALAGCAAAVAALGALNRWFALNLWELASWVRGTAGDNRGP